MSQIVSDADKLIAHFSNYGPWVNTFALGVHTVSTYLAGGNANTKVDDEDPKDAQQSKGPFTGFALWNGTSFAAPLVAGQLSREGGTCDPKGRHFDA